jgi:hypothetical protein
MRSTRSPTCCSVRTVVVSCGRPVLATNTFPGSLIQISSMSGSSKKGCSGPMPMTRSATVLATRPGSASGGMLATSRRSA